MGTLHEPRPPLEGGVTSAAHGRAETHDNTSEPSGRRNSNSRTGACGRGSGPGSVGLAERGRRANHVIPVVARKHCNQQHVEAGQAERS